MPTAAKAVRDLKDREAFFYLGKVRHITESPKVRGNTTTLQVNLDTGEPEEMSLCSDAKVKLFSQPRRVSELEPGDTFDFMGQRNTLIEKPSRPTSHEIVTLRATTTSGTAQAFRIPAGAELDVQV